MLRNYLKITLRNLKRNMVYTVISVVGLAVGIACCVLIARWVQQERSYDTFHTNADRIYRVYRDDDEGGPAKAIVGASMAAELKQDFPDDIRATVRLVSEYVFVRRTEETEVFEERRFFFVDSSFFDVFDGFTLAQGHPASALARPGTVVITERTAKKYFRDEDPIDQTLILPEEDLVLTVTGVLAEAPSNSHVHFDFLTSIATLKQIEGSSTEEMLPGYIGTWTYLQLAEKASAEALSAQLLAFNRRRLEPALAEKTTPHLQRLTDIHLHSDLANEIEAGGSSTLVNIFSVLAVFILLIACINFINLATARSSQRAREVGVRKTFGARKKQLMGQFLSESTVLTFIALVLGMVLIQLLLPVFNAASGANLVIDYTSSVSFWLTLLGIALFIGLVAGSYPAFMLSQFRPTQVLKSSLPASLGGSAGLRKSLVVFQFFVSIALIAGALITYQQLAFLQNSDLGFDKGHVLVMPVEDNYEVLREEVSKGSGVMAVSGIGVRPGFGSGRSNPQYELAPFTISVRALEGKPAQYMNLDEVDYDFFEMMDLEMVAGRSFSKAFSDRGRRVRGDTANYYGSFVRGRGVVLNEAAVMRLGLTPTEALGKEIRFFEADGNRYVWDRGGPIVGVVEDFHAASLHEQIQPLAYTLGGDQYLLAKIAPAYVGGALDMLRTISMEVNPDQPFDAAFLDESLAAQYIAEERLSRVMGLFALLAVVVACLGLFGLAAYTAEQRTKEIGIRKIVGASVTSIVVLLSKDFLKLVGIAFVVAAPVAYLATNQWLQDFAYHIDLRPWVFLEAGVLALVIAFFTVTYQAIKAGQTNPAEALRNE